MASPHPWLSLLRDSGKPRYLAIADAIAGDLRDGRLRDGDRLPPQRTLAQALEVDFTTVARGYAEAQRRGLIDSRVGAGTFARNPPPEAAAPAAEQPPPPLAAPPGGLGSRRIADLSMNLPPDIEDPALIARMRQGLDAVADGLIDLLRYQAFGGSDEDRQAGADWLARRGLRAPIDRLLVCPGTHSALHAALATAAKTGDAVCAEELAYPGLRGLAAQLGLELIGLPMDGDGVLPDAFAAACRRRAPKAFYCNPTLHNPTTITTPTERRLALIEVARRHNVAIIEDDAYGALPVDGPPALAALAPELTFYVASLGKCLGGGLRVAYLVVPDARHIWRMSAFLRAATVMASPLTTALAARWIADGVADAMLDAVRREAAQRQALARALLPAADNGSKPQAFHLWLPLPPGWSRSGFAATLRAVDIGVVVSDAFALNNPPPEAARICLGGRGAAEIRSALEKISHTLSNAPEFSSAFL